MSSQQKQYISTQRAWSFAPPPVIKPYSARPTTATHPSNNSGVVFTKYTINLKGVAARTLGVAMSNKQINFIGWILFILSALGFIIASIGSFWSMVGSVFFLVACLVFLIPFFRPDD
jgi:hypothetical protein